MKKKVYSRINDISTLENEYRETKCICLSYNHITKGVENVIKAAKFSSIVYSYLK